MKRFVCWMLTHSIDSIVWYHVGGVYPRYMGWCDRCGHWIDVTGGVPGRVLGIMPREWWLKEPSWPK